MVSQSFGFPNLPHKGFAASSQVPQPPKPKGRLLIGFIFLAGIVYIGYMVWDAYFRHAAYGVIDARIVEVSSPYDAAIASLEVSEGEHVRQNQVLMTVENFELKANYAAARDNLAIASSELTAQVSRMKLDYAFHLDNTTGIIVGYYELVARLGQEQGRLEETRDFSKRAERLLKGNAVSAEESNALKFRLAGCEKSVRELTQAIEDARERVKRLEKVYDKKVVLDSWQEQLKPLERRIEYASAEIDRIKEKIELGKIISPVSGTVAKRYQYAGERCTAGKALFSIIEDSTTYVILYVQQEVTSEYYIGRNLELYSPFGVIFCTVERVGDKYETAPDSIKRFYKASQNLLPIHLKMNDSYNLKYGATVKLPYFGR